MQMICGKLELVPIMEFTEYFVSMMDDNLIILTNGFQKKPQHPTGNLKSHKY